MLRMPRNRLRPRQKRNLARFTWRLHATLLVLVLVVASACGGSLEPYETTRGSATYLDGKVSTVPSLALSEVVKQERQNAVYVHGYLLAPRDDEPRLCTRLEKSGACRSPSVILDTTQVHLDGAEALEHGCCSLGFWSPHPLVLRVKVLSDGRARVIE
jgi:hypothetical protein